MARVHGGRLVAQALARHGVKHVFTLCGGHIQAIYDGCIDEGIRVVDVRHEQTAGHAADGSARVTGVPGVALVTAGPGVTDVVTALANALRAQVPLVCIGGAGPKALADMGSLQDMDSVTLMRPVSKWSVQVPETRRIAEYIDHAYRIAQAGVPGPVYLEIPLDLLMASGDDAATEPAPQPAPPGGDRDAVARAVELLGVAKRPLFIVGSQIYWSPKRDVLRAIADRFRVPFFLNGLARGGLPHDHHCLLGRCRKAALKASDLVFVLGTPFDFRLNYGRTPTFSPNAKVVHIDLDAAALGRNRKVDVAIAGDSGAVLEQLLDAAGEYADGTFLSELRTTENEARTAMRREMDADTDPPNPLRVCHEVGKRLGPEDIVVGDGGDFVATAAYTIPISWPQLWMDPGPLGTLGVGPGYAMAAALARPHAKTVIMYGDGSFGLHGLEFEAMVRQGIPVVGIIGNDAAWTQIRRGQIQIYGEERAVATELAHTRYDRVVEAVGGRGFWVEHLGELGPALDLAFSSSVPSLVNVKIAKSDFRKGAISV
jgi:acetolactate synthase-1/2/3 large subunit